VGVREPARVRLPRGRHREPLARPAAPLPPSRAGPPSHANVSGPRPVPLRARGRGLRHSLRERRTGVRRFSLASPCPTGHGPGTLPLPRGRAGGSGAVPAAFGGRLRVRGGPAGGGRRRGSRAVRLGRFHRLRTVRLRLPLRGTGPSVPSRALVRERDHWHLDLYPRLVRPDGFDIGSGYPVNTVTPEVAAEALRTELGAKR